MTYIKSILKRLNDGEQALPSAPRETGPASPAAERRSPVLEKSEITRLFQAVLEEKQRDLPLRQSDEN